MASEIRATGVDLSFAPVVDLGRGNRAIGNRAFSRGPAGRRRIHPRLRARHARRRHGGHAQAFPRATARCSRTPISTTRSTRARWTRSARIDLVPFVAGIEAGADAVMMAHVVYPAGRAGTGRLFAALDRATSCAGRWASAAWCSPTTSAWPRRSRPAASRRASTRTWTPAATWCWSAIRNWSRNRCAAVEGRTLNTMALAGLIGRGAMGWDGLLADARYGDARGRLRADSA